MATAGSTIPRALAQRVVSDNTNRERQKGLQKSPIFKNQNHEEGTLMKIFSDIGSKIHR